MHGFNGWIHGNLAHKRRIDGDGDVLSSTNQLLLPLPLSQFAGLRGKEKRGMKKKRGDGLQDQLFMLG